jgi:hypothetical protein
MATMTRLDLMVDRFLMRSQGPGLEPGFNVSAYPNCGCPGTG